MNVESWSQTLLNAADSFLTKVMGFAPNFILAIIILLVGFFIAKIIAMSIGSVLKKTGFNSFCDSTGLHAMINKLSPGLTGHMVIQKLTFIFLILLTIMTGAETLGLDKVSAVIDDFILYIPKLLGAFAIVLIGMYLGSLAKGSTENAASGMGMDYSSGLGKLVQLIILATTFSLAIAQLEFETAFLNLALAILLGAVALAVAISMGFGSKRTADNVISGVYVREIIKRGDAVKWDGKSAEVIEVGTVMTILCVKGKDYIAVPNYKLTTSDFGFSKEDE